MFNLNFILNIYANPDDADFDQSKTISSSEALSLAFALFTYKMLLPYIIAEAFYIIIYLHYMKLLQILLQSL